MTQMKFESMLAFWKMKDMIKVDHCLTRDKIYNSDSEHVVFSLVVKNSHRGMHANVLYRFEKHNGTKTKFALVYADILYSGFPAYDGGDSTVFKKNAKVSDLCYHFVDR